jgi:P27 family predicted phage terminase small subunit
MNIPKYLSPAARRWWKEVTEAYELEPHHLKVLEVACRTWDRLTEAQAALRKHGATYEDRFSQPRARPEVAVERDCTATFARLVRDLGLDIEPAKPVGRPPGR